MEDDNIENYLGEIEKELEVGIRSCRDEEEVRRYCNDVMTSFMNQRKICTYKFGIAEITDDHIGLTFAYRPNIDYYHETDQAEQPRFIFLKNKEKYSSIDDMIFEVDEELEKEEAIKQDQNDQDKVNSILDEIDEM